MQVLGIAGWSGSGKTTLVERLIPALIARGITVSTVKHAHHAFDVDRPGKDSWRHRAAGAQEVVVASAARLALMQELRGAPEPELPEIVARLKPVDLVLVEGFKRQPIPKLEVHRAIVGKPLLHTDDPWIIAVASDEALPGCPLPQLPLDEPEAIAGFILARLFGARASSNASQAIGDCFAHGGGDLSVAEAVALIEGRVGPVCAPEPAPRPLVSALGHVLAEDLVAQRTVPAQDNSAVDGYALRHADLAPDGPTRLRITGRAAAGRPLEGELAPGGAVRIFTGAPLPPGADTVVMQEDVTVEEGTVTVPAGVVRGAHRRPAGEDCRTGATVIPAGTRLGPRQIALAAASGATALTVRRPLRVTLFSTGDELATGHAVDSNRPMLLALLGNLGVSVTDGGILRDNPDAVREALAAAAASADLIITSGGVSVGEEDHVRAAVATLGSLHLWRIAMKPGRPLALGQIGKACFLGLPGNPVAAYIGFVRFGVPLICRLAGAAISPAHTLVRAGFTLQKKPGRTEFLRAMLQTDGDGQPVAVGDPGQGSGRLGVLASAEVLVEIEPHVTQIRPGDIVRALPLWQHL